MSSITKLVDDDDGRSEKNLRWRVKISKWWTSQRTSDKNIRRDNQVLVLRLKTSLSCQGHTLYYCAHTACFGGGYHGGT